MIITAMIYALIILHVDIDFIFLAVAVLVSFSVSALALRYTIICTTSHGKLFKYEGLYHFILLHSLILIFLSSSLLVISNKRAMNAYTTFTGIEIVLISITIRSHEVQ